MVKGSIPEGLRENITRQAQEASELFSATPLSVGTAEEGSMDDPVFI